MRLAVILSLLFLPACTTTIYPPKDVGRPVAVAILDHGRHSSLIVQSGPDSMIRYSYGDWRFYAQADTGVIQASRALLWPTKAGMGRQEMAGPVDPENISNQMKVISKEILVMRVEEDRARQLIGELETIYRERLQTRYVNEPYGMEFVQHPENYWAFRNSNQMIGRWLKQLGCETRGGALFSSWKIDRP